MSQKESPRGAGRHSALGRGSLWFRRRLAEVCRESSQVDPLTSSSLRVSAAQLVKEGSSTQRSAMPKAATSGPHLKEDKSELLRLRLCRKF